jgi:branched-chain amino acid transport system permease protein
MKSRAAQLLGRVPWAGNALMLIVPLLALAVAIDLYDDLMLERIVINMFVSIILVVGLQLFTGNSGLVSFGHISFMAIGAYASVLLIMSPDKKAYTLPYLTGPLSQIEIPFIPGILLAALFTAVLAALVGFPLMRLSGSAATMATFAFLIITHVILINAETYTRGTRTMYGLENYTTFWMSVIWGILVIIGGFLFKESKVGLMLRASREQEEAASAIGVNIVMVRWAAFIISAFISALGGALWAHFITSISPYTMYMHTTFLTVAMLIVGGTGSVSGAVVGTVAITGLFEGLRAIEIWISTFRIAGQTAAGFTEVWLGVGMILLMVLRPFGLMMGQEVRLPTRLRARFEARATESEG